MAKVARKLTIRDACSLTVSEIAKLGAAEKTPLLQVIGQASDYKYGETQMGGYFKFWGQFEATDMATGEVTASGVAIFPGVLADTLVGAIGKEKNTVRFAGVFGVEPAKRAGSSIPFQYYFEPTVAPAGGADALADLRKSLAALPAPKKGDDKPKKK